MITIVTVNIIYRVKNPTVPLLVYSLGPIMIELSFF